MHQRWFDVLPPKAQLWLGANDMQLLVASAALKTVARVRESRTSIYPERKEVYLCRKQRSHHRSPSCRKHARPFRLLNVPSPGLAYLEQRYGSRAPRHARHHPTLLEGTVCCERIISITNGAALQRYALIIEYGGHTSLNFL